MLTYIHIIYIHIYPLSYKSRWIRIIVSSVNDLITAIGQFALLDLLCVTLKLTQSKHCCFCWMQGSFAGTNYHGGQVGSLSLTFTQISSSGINMAQFSYVPAAIKFWAQFSHRDRYNNSREFRGLLFNHTWHFSYILLYIRAKVLLCS